MYASDFYKDHGRIFDVRAAVDEYMKKGETHKGSTFLAARDRLRHKGRLLRLLINKLSKKPAENHELFKKTVKQYKATLRAQDGMAQEYKAYGVKKRRDIKIVRDHDVAQRKNSSAQKKNSSVQKKGSITTQSLDFIRKNYKTMGAIALAAAIGVVAYKVYKHYSKKDPKLGVDKAKQFVSNAEAKCSQSVDPAKCKEKLRLLSKKWDAKKKAVQAQT